MSFIKKSVPPPIVDKGDRFLAKILEMEYPVKGEYKEQIQWRLQLPKEQDGYEATVWTTYYKEPSDRSILGQLCMTYMKVADGPFDNVDDVLKAVKKHGQIYVECTGHRKWQDQEYPKFQIYPTKIPGSQKQLEETNLPVDEEALEKLSPEQRQRLIKKLSMQQ